MDADDDRTIDRFVAGAPVDADELASAMTAKAMDRAVVVESLLKNLAAPEPVIRRRAAERVARMPDAAPALVAALRRMAVDDGVARVREACAAALRVHGETVPGDPAAASEPVRDRFSLRFVLQAVVSRSGETPYHARVEAAYEHEAPDLRGFLYPDAPGARIEWEGLPAGFAGTRPVLRARRAPGGPVEAIAQADAPVTPAGAVTMIVRLEDATVDDVAEWLRTSDLVLPDD